MKALWITLAVLAALGLACCGGIFFFGRGAINAIKENNAAADDFCAKIFPEIAAEWDPAVIAKYASPDYAPSHLSGDLKTELASYKDTYGKFISVGEFTASNSEFKSDGGGSAVYISTSARAKFEKGTAKVQMRVVKRKDVWKLDWMAVR